MRAASILRYAVTPILACAFCAVAYAATHYVRSPGTCTNTALQYPYTNWDTAATQIHWAVDAAVGGDTVLVSNGTYYLTNKVSIAVALTTTSVNGRNVTIVDGNNYPGKQVTNRCFSILAAAILDGFTVRNGFVSGGGGGIYCSSGGQVKNCLITANTSTNTSNNGGGIYLLDGTISNCDIIGNLSAYGMGGGIFANGTSWVINCAIASNTASPMSTGGEVKGGGIFAFGNSVVIDKCNIYENDATGSAGQGGGALLQNGPILRNSLVYNNRANNGEGGGVFIYYSYGKIQNCTIVSNYANNGGGIWASTAAQNTSYIENTVCYLNRGASSNFYVSTVLGNTGYLYIVNSCIAPTSAFPTAAIAGYYYANNIQTNPQFAGKDAGNFRLGQGSPCINSGTNESWMNLDLDGHSRIDRFSGMADMGCYEYIFTGMKFDAR